MRGWRFLRLSVDDFVYTFTGWSFIHVRSISTHKINNISENLFLKYLMKIFLQTFQLVDHKIIQIKCASRSFFSVSTTTLGGRFRPLRVRIFSLFVSSWFVFTFERFKPGLKTKIKIQSSWLTQFSSWPHVTPSLHRAYLRSRRLIKCALIKVPTRRLKHKVWIDLKL